MIVRGTKSGKKSAGRRVGESTGGTFSGNDSVAAVTIKLDFPVPRSPATTTRTPLRPPELKFPAKPPNIGRKQVIETERRREERASCGETWRRGFLEVWSVYTNY